MKLINTNAGQHRISNLNSKPNTKIFAKLVAKHAARCLKCDVIRSETKIDKHGMPKQFVHLLYNGYTNTILYYTILVYSYTRIMALKRSHSRGAKMFIFRQNNADRSLRLRLDDGWIGRLLDWWGDRLAMTMKMKMMKMLGKIYIMCFGKCDGKRIEGGGKCVTSCERH